MIYIQEEIADHERTHQILSRLPDAERIPCEDWREVFQRPGQNFRLQKRRPSLILGRMEDKLVEAAPPGLSFGARRNYVFAPMLNCIYDCSYCYLQGRFPSAAYVLFVNFEDFMEVMDDRLAESPDEDVWFFSGIDCDSLAFEPVSRMAQSFLSFFAERPRAFLELRTKSAQVRPLLSREPMDNCVTAFSVTPEDMSRRWEGQTPAMESRLAAARRLQEAGWPVGLRFEPLLWSEDWEKQYDALFNRVFEVLDPEALHSVSCGVFRLPLNNWNRLKRLYPESPFVRGPVEKDADVVTYREDLAAELRGHCVEQLRERLPEGVLYEDAHTI